MKYAHTRTDAISGCRKLVIPGAISWDKVSNFGIVATLYMSFDMRSKFAIFWKLYQNDFDIYKRRWVTFLCDNYIFSNQIVIGMHVYLDNIWDAFQKSIS